MPFTKKILIVLLGLYIVFLLSGFLLPKSSIAHQKITFNTCQQHAFSYIRNHEAMHQWLSWMQYDKTIKIKYVESKYGLADQKVWLSQNTRVGQGSLEYTAIDAPKRVNLTMLHNTAQLNLQFEIDAIKPSESILKWTFTALHSNIFERFIGFFSFKEIVEADMKASLLELERLIGANQENTFCVVESH